MSFRLFIYYCAICGGCGAYVGWMLGRIASPQIDILQAGVKGMFLGLVVALALGLIDGLWNGGGTQIGRLIQQLAKRCRHLLAEYTHAEAVGCQLAP